MSYLDKAVFEMKQKITAVCDNLRIAETDGRTAEEQQRLEEQEMDRLEKLIREKLVESFKNGIEVGRKQGENSKHQEKRGRNRES